MNENDFEMLMKEIVLEEMDIVKPPPKDEIWKYISSQIDAQRRRERLRKMKPFIAASVVIIVSAALVCFNPSIRVTADNMIKVVASFADGVFNVNKSENTELDTVNVTGDPRIDEAQKKLSFDIMTPKFLPEGYKLFDVKVLDMSSGLKKITLFFEKYTKNLGKIYLTIEEVVYSENINININYRSNEKTQLSKMVFNGQQYTVICYGDDDYQIIWTKNGMWFEIIGMESLDTLTKIAESIE